MGRWRGKSRQRPPTHGGGGGWQLEPVGSRAEVCWSVRGAPRRGVGEELVDDVGEAGIVHRGGQEGVREDAAQEGAEPFAGSGGWGGAGG